jgi:hypothetical protein
VTSLTTVREVVVVEVEVDVLELPATRGDSGTVDRGRTTPVGDGIKPSEMATETGHTVV